MPRIVADPRGAAQVAEILRQALERRSTRGLPLQRDSEFERNSVIEELIARVSFPDRDAARDAAIDILSETDREGRNHLLEALAKYRDYPADEDVGWAAMMTLESLAELAPWLIQHELLSDMADHPDFSMRSSAAVICMGLAQFAPASVEMDVLLRLARHDEDWYVSAPATAARQAMVRHRPTVLRVFLGRLHSSDAGVREHAAQALAGIAGQEPEVLDAGELQHELVRLQELGDEMAVQYIAEALPAATQSDRVSPFRYGL